MKLGLDLRLENLEVALLAHDAVYHDWRVCRLSGLQLCSSGMDKKMGGQAEESWERETKERTQKPRWCCNSHSHGVKTQAHCRYRNEEWSSSNMSPLPG